MKLDDTVVAAVIIVAIVAIVAMSLMIGLLDTKVDKHEELLRGIRVCISVGGIPEFEIGDRLITGCEVPNE